MVAPTVEARLMCPPACAERHAPVRARAMGAGESRCQHGDAKVGGRFWFAGGGVQGSRVGWDLWCLSPLLFIEDVPLGALLQALNLRKGGGGLGSGAQDSWRCKISGGQDSWWEGSRIILCVGAWTDRLPSGAERPSLPADPE